MASDAEYTNSDFDSDESPFTVLLVEYRVNGGGWRFTAVCGRRQPEQP